MVERRLCTDIVGKAGTGVSESMGCDTSKASVGRHFIKEPQMWTGWIEAWEAEICGGLLEGRWEGC